MLRTKAKCIFSIRALFVLIARVLVNQVNMTNLFNFVLMLPNQNISNINECYNNYCMNPKIVHICFLNLRSEGLIRQAA